ncbi:MAG: hypothetical protein ACTHNP_09725 [Solirubrobacterales bacterium]
MVIDGSFTIDSGPGDGPCPVPAGPQQTQTPPSTMPATMPRPIVQLLRRPPHRSHDRTPTFRFTSTVADSAFKCKVDHRSWRSCHSPQTLRKLPLGSHTFRIRAIAPAGEKSAVAAYRFVIAP